MISEFPSHVVLSAASIPGPGRGDHKQTLGQLAVESSFPLWGEVNSDTLREAERDVWSLWEEPGFQFWL